MQESFLHFIWKHQYFDKKQLTTTEGEIVDITSPGVYNTNAGPDFSHAKLKIGSIEWIGNVEIHLRSSDWHRHDHQTDKAYDNVILHVVWEDDKPIKRTDSSRVPALALHNRVNDNLLKESNRLLNSPEKIPCSNQIADINRITIISTLDKALMERLERKASDVMQDYEQTKNDWEETTYRLLCKNFGFKTNSPPFEQLSKALPFKILRKHVHSPIKVEALLFGQAGFLDDAKDDYQLKLQQEYDFLSQKYGLHKTQLQRAQWKFARLRPANFPTLRIAQLAAIIIATKNLFSAFIEVSEYKALIQLFKAQLSPYWQQHYRFGTKASGRVSAIGKSSIENVIINTIVPLLAAYRNTVDNQSYIDKAISYLENTSHERNRIIKQWAEIGIEPVNAFDSQALIELFNNSCSVKKCLHCNIGMQLLQRQN